jgi:hypothetical protein
MKQERHVKHVHKVFALNQITFSSWTSGLGKAKLRNNKCTINIYWMMSALVKQRSGIVTYMVLQYLLD